MPAPLATAPPAATPSAAATPASIPPSGRALLVVGIVLVALNLRPALAGVGPLVADIRLATGLSNTALGLLTTLPLLAFGVVSAFTPVVTRRLGMEGAIGLALVLIGGGVAVRAVPSVALLFAGTVVLGVGIALGNVLLPALVKRDFSDRSGPMTSLYSSAMGLGATVAAGVSVPLAAAVGWRGALGAWALLAAAALAVWAPQLRRRTRTARRGTVLDSLRDLGRSRLAWAVALFMGLQSLAFYVILAWLPDLLQSRGLNAEEAGWMLALSQAAGIAGSAVAPLWAGRMRDQRPIIWTLAVLEAVALAGLLFAGTTLVGVWVGLLGFVLGGSFGLSLLFLAIRADTPETAAELSGMAQSVGYLVAAVGPALFGGLHDLTGGWTVPLLSLVVVLVVKVAVGLPAARDEQVRRADAPGP
ncbi:MFS transporter [Rubrivirga sp. S365]|uniref:CynX/NimT family MFS transporter n=1 Tax=Rubrivirga sp. S365 TaxID=3076080 RepID=UPI0028C648EB|nr:MFS transporter [Rubrivirga sp. S365]MDT7857374.1 MFS transporter [Rubrivirga sp. S365]